jgi:hypothetical protein
MQKRSKYRKHLVKVGQGFMPVKDWMRQNPSKFRHVEGVPTTFQIGDVLVQEGFSREATSELVLFARN